MEKFEVIKKLTDCGLVAVVRAKSEEEAIKIADACLEGGCTGIELTFTVPGAHKVIEALANKYNKGEMMLGAGTVLDSETARTAILAGANYIVSPGFNLEAAKLCNRYQVPYMPGCMTITEVLTAMEAGCDIIKIFPADLFGPTIIKDIKGPQAELTFPMLTSGLRLAQLQLAQAHLLQQVQKQATMLKLLKLQKNLLLKSRRLADNG